LACALHVPIGIAKIVQEWGGASPRVASRLSQLFAAVIVIMGLAAVWGVSAQ
jgi:fumarate reductase subunit C